MNKFYIASRFKNIDSVQYVSEILVNKGYGQKMRGHHHLML